MHVNRSFRAMKIILSRKGFDSACGGVASPVLPDGRLVSLPIPEPRPWPESRRYREIQPADGINLGTLVRDLTRGKVRAADRAHLDPDLDAASVPRPPGWRPLFGQTGAAERHLQNQGVGPGDLFLFYGWFRPCVRVRGRYFHVPDAPHRHVLYGWLQVERRLSAHAPETWPAWAAGHPHCQAEPYRALDSIYVSADRLEVAGLSRQLPGGGTFGTYRPELCLTAAGRTRSWWRLPAWFRPDAGRAPLSYHGDPARWKPGTDHVLLDTAKQGQEFVLDTGHYPEALSWLVGLFGGQS